MSVNKIGIVIKTLRQKAGMTQLDLAKKLGVTDKAVSKWERGIGTPDISMINKISHILNIDADNLLAGNIAYLENEWVGVLVLDKFKCDFSLGVSLYGKPFVYLFLCYFVLAGIDEVYIFCESKQESQIKLLQKPCEELGLTIHINTKLNDNKQKVMKISGPIFIYGPNLTKYFQRCMSSQRPVMTLVIPKKDESSGFVYLDGKNQVSDVSENRQKYYELPISFGLLGHKESGYEPVGNGMIAFELKGLDDLVDAEYLHRLVKNKLGTNMYCLEEIAYRRGLISEEKFRKIKKL